MHALNKNRPLRRIVLASAATVSGMVLLLALKPHTAPTVATASAKSPAASSSSAPGSASGTRTATGDTAQTRWGPVQVRVTVRDGRLTDVTAVAYPQDNPRDQEINSYALPQLRREALAAQSAEIDTVSGATYTSDGYRQSLQSALDSAGL
ncbi:MULTISPECIES: FMN-binding protein [Streptomyces]|uniref:FMN-binding protein n=1 Tax=Streptomyces flaveolus TaxID=67297 RepID=A0ABV3A3R6_9ACTN|nr:MULTISPECIES: FMN-binding protein [Streptomyces]KOG63572.1 FMN-binding protein [Streptomyces antibioticus]KOV86477.1 FMN-binding protein [Streptomyces sp. NRRL WC-3723]MBG7703853.1 FMN-binding protein [Streptomyces sp. MC1]